ncbi:hypothetical protein ACIGN6_31635 [Streptomyces sp. NPDC053792]|uniref:hypothetical protein n=1 Tax=Streptomyces sp. NPDC053792 TaxID=3365716 RepID=UPI0037D26464
MREAWAEGIERTVPLSVLVAVGLTDSAELAAAGLEPVLLAAIERGQGWDRPSRTADAVGGGDGGGGVSEGLTGAVVA